MINIIGNIKAIYGTEQLTLKYVPKVFVLNGRGSANGIQNKMIKILFSLIATVMFAFSGIASNINDDVYAQVKVSSVEKNSNLKPKSEISIRFNSKEEMDKFNFDIFEFLTLSDVSVTVYDGSENIRGSVTITAKDVDSSSIKDKIISLTEQVKDVLASQMK